eukprot:14282309-Alexandrium_andersonii.AAC.1
MSASLVGSEMCIRDRKNTYCHMRCVDSTPPVVKSSPHPGGLAFAALTAPSCLLYTSDAADDM